MPFKNSPANYNGEKPNIRPPLRTRSHSPTESVFNTFNTPRYRYSNKNRKKRQNTHKDRWWQCRSCGTVPFANGDIRKQGDERRPTKAQELTGKTSIASGNGRTCLPRLICQRQGDFIVATSPSLVKGEQQSFDIYDDVISACFSSSFLFYTWLAARGGATIKVYICGKVALTKDIKNIHRLCLRRLHLYLHVHNFFVRCGYSFGFPLTKFVPYIYASTGSWTGMDCGENSTSVTMRKIGMLPRNATILKSQSK